MICHPVAKSIIFCFLFFGVLNKQNYLKLNIKYQIIVSVVLGLIISGVASKLYSNLVDDSELNSVSPASPSSVPAPVIGGIPPEVPGNVSDKDDDLRDSQHTPVVATAPVVTEPESEPEQQPVPDSSAVGGYYLLNQGQFSSQGLSLDGVKKIAIGGKFAEIMN